MSDHTKKTREQLIAELSELEARFDRLSAQHQGHAGFPKIDVRHRVLYNSFPAGIILQRADGHILFANDIAGEILEMAPSEIEGRTSGDPGWHMIDEQGHPVDAHEHPSMITLRTGKPLRSVVRGIFTGGQQIPKWLLIHTEPIFDPPGETPSEVFVIVVDITGQKATEQALRESEVFHRTLIETIPDLVWVKNADGVYLSCNHAFERFFGEKLQNIKGKKDSDFVSDELAQFFRTHDLLAMERNGPSINEEWLTFADGSKSGLFETIKSPMRDADGNLVGIMGIARDVTDRMRTEKALTKAKEKAERLLSIAGVAIITVLKNESIGLVNPKACQILEYKADELIGRNWFDTCIPAGIRAEIRDVFHTLISGTSEHLERFENAVLTKSGKERTIAWHNTPLFDESNTIMGYLCSGEDVTEERVAQRRLAKTLRISEQLARENDEFFKAAKELLQHETFDEAAQNLFQACLRMTGATGGFIAISTENPHDIEMVYAHSHEVPFPPKERLRMARRGILDECLSTCRAIFDNNFIANPLSAELPNEHMRIKNILCAPLRMGSGSVGIIAIANKPGHFTGHDASVSETFGDLAAIALNRMQAQQEQLRQTTLFSAMFDNMPVMTIYSAGIPSQRTANKAFTRLTGWTLDDIQSPDFHLKIFPDPTYREWALGVMAQAAGEWTEMSLQTKNGPPLLSSWTNILVGDTTLMGIGLDLTDELRVEKEKRALIDQLHHSQKMESIGRLAGGISHDFNNLLTGINGYVEMILESLDAEDPLREDVDEIRRAGERATDLIAQLLIFSRNQMISPKVIRPNDIIERSQKMLRRIIGEDIHVEFRKAPDLGLMRVDPSQMDQILVNLAVNARDAMPHGGELIFTTENRALDEAFCRKRIEAHPGDYVTISVSDTGCGIDAEALPLIFEPFFSTKGMGKGTGLGLSTVYGITKQNQGFIDVSTTVGSGTTFTLFFPRVTDEPDVLQVRASQEMPTGTETILLVEDEAMVRKLTKRILENQGYSIIEAENGGEAFLIFERRSQEIDLLITDVIMPAMGGRQLADRLHKIQPHLKVIFVSGYTEETIGSHGVLDKGTNFIQKPFRAEELARAVRDVLDSSV